MGKLIVTLFATALGVAVVFGWPYINETRAKWGCDLEAPNAGCVELFREVGHSWSLHNDLPRASLWYAYASHAGDAASLFHLAWVHETEGLTQLAIRHLRLKRLYGRESPAVRRQRADEFFESNPPFLRSFVIAESLYRQSAEQGFDPAMNNLGQLYMLGVGLPFDIGQAFDWHLQAARAGNPVARWNIAIAYAQGLGVTPSRARALDYATWHPSGTEIPEGLRDMALRRTRLYSANLPEIYRAEIRHGLKQGRPVTIALETLEAPPDWAWFSHKPWAPSPDIPSFGDVLDRAARGEGGALQSSDDWARMRGELEAPTPSQRFLLDYGPPVLRENYDQVLGGMEETETLMRTPDDE
ncbi:tetratricopeptide repeat protein [Algihabitans albus]|uniref:tetratricopeptide repeat protein n=1 Tax=Algihabitans albus TaxID=2164067 RepID=UPI000E5CA8F7|nr:tetratricopeptide repeat protein [Algihabitans albus]